MDVRAILTLFITLLLGGCHSLRMPTSPTVYNDPDIPVVDVHVEVEELPGLFQTVD